MAELNKRSEGIPVLSMLEGSGDHYFSSGNSADYFYHYNLIGNVMFLTDSNGNKVAEYLQEGFGNVLASIGSAPNNYHLTTKEQEPETGLYYFYARWYDPQVGRFITHIEHLYIPIGKLPTEEDITQWVEWFLKIKDLYDAGKACGKIPECWRKADAAQNEILDWCDNFCMCLFGNQPITNPQTRGCAIGCEIARRKIGLL